MRKAIFFSVVVTVIVIGYFLVGRPSNLAPETRYVTVPVEKGCAIKEVTLVMAGRDAGLYRMIVGPASLPAKFTRTKANRYKKRCSVRSMAPELRSVR